MITFNEQLLRPIYLHGYLKDHIPGGVFYGAWNTAKEAARCIEVNFPGLRNKIKDRHVQVWQSKGSKEVDLDEDDLLMRLGGDELHIAPVVEGSGRGGKIILGLALFAVGLGAAALAGGGLIAGLGAAAPGFLGSTLGLTAGNLVLTGGLMALNAALAPTAPKGDFSQNEQERKPSAIYRGPLVTQEQGVSYPLVFGFGVIAGGAVIHAEIDVSDVPVSAA